MGVRRGASGGIVAGWPRRCRFRYRQSVRGLIHVTIAACGAFSLATTTHPRPASGIMSMPEPGPACMVIVDKTLTLTPGVVRAAGGAALSRFAHAAAAVRLSARHGARAGRGQPPVQPGAGAHLRAGMGA